MSSIQNRNWVEVTKGLANSRCVVLDDFLSNNMCEHLNKRMIECKNFDDRYPNGYYANDYDLSDDITETIVKDLQNSCAELLNNFVRAWSFIYDNEANGVGIHSDPSNFNVNIWVTPDECVKDPYSNGLNIYQVPIPPDSKREEYNNRDNPYLKNLIYSKPHSIFRIPYKCNRAIIFDASLPHETDRVSMIDGLKNRRVSYTMLYGDGPFVE